MDEQLMIALAKDDAEWAQLDKVTNEVGDVCIHWFNATTSQTAISCEYADGLWWDQWCGYEDAAFAARVFEANRERFTRKAI
ncbi:hypothetical protein [Streptomyces sp. NPDC127112]|uniref:hypothetical protein n=1 Tax=Streptomyces sp. NPDC127112 TaxID=3345364 RepID=UPI0036396E40